VQNLTSDSCSATPICYKGDDISRLTRLIINIPIVGYFGVLGVFRYFGYLGGFGGIQLLLVQNLTPESCSTTPISYVGDKISRLFRLVFWIPIVGYFRHWGQGLPKVVPMQNGYHDNKGRSGRSLIDTFDWQTLKTPGLVQTAYMYL